METLSGQPRLLIVDDDPLCIEVLGKMLGSEYEVLAATSGAEALALSVSHLPELVVLDIAMPEMDGYEVCKRLKENEATQDIPIVFMTAKDGDESEIKGLSLGARDYLHKASNPRLLKLRIKNMLESKRRLQGCSGRQRVLSAPEGSSPQDSASARYLGGTFSICCNCKKIKDRCDEWLQLEDFFLQNSDLLFSHGFCPECAREYLADIKRTDP